MIWLKSFLVGVCALLAFAVVAMFVYPFLLQRRYDIRGPVGIDWISVLSFSPGAWLLLALVFAAGFLWEYRRLMR